MTKPPKALCPTCGRPPKAEAATRLRKYLLRVFSADAVAYRVIEDGFAALLAPEAQGGAGCANELEAVLAAFREMTGTYAGGVSS